MVDPRGQSSTGPYKSCRSLDTYFQNRSYMGDSLVMVQAELDLIHNLNISYHDHICVYRGYLIGNLRLLRSCVGATIS
jgi:hypothetical protein